MSYYQKWMQIQLESKFYRSAKREVNFFTGQLQFNPTIDEFTTTLGASGNGCLQQAISSLWLGKLPHLKGEKEKNKEYRSMSSRQRDHTVPRYYP